MSKRTTFIRTTMQLNEVFSGGTIWFRDGPDIRPWPDTGRTPDIMLITYRISKFGARTDTGQIPDIMIITYPDTEYPTLVLGCIQVEYQILC